MAIRLFANLKGTERIDLPELGIWIEVRQELSVGEKRRIFSDAFKGQTDIGGGQMRTEYDARKLTFGLIAAHIVDWNASQEQDGKVVPVPYRVEALEGLTSAAYEVIEKAVDKYTEASKQALGEASPATSAAPTSLSLAG